MAGFLLGDGWLENRSGSVRLGISMIIKFADVAVFLRTLLFGMGYISDYSLEAVPLVRDRVNAQPYYQFRTFSFRNLIAFNQMWYEVVNGKLQKRVPRYLKEVLTPLVLALWVMADGSGMKEGGFKLSSHSFTKEDNQYLCNLLLELYGIKANVLKECNYYYIRVLTGSAPLLKSLVSPYLLSSCDYKFRFVKSS